LEFAKDARNLRLGLATDGFNPFSEKSTKYSVWPVFVVSYNLLPRECMEESNFMMTLLIPGPASPGKDFDMILEPLVEDLLELWSGVHAYDGLSGKMFNLHVVVLWCIHDYPALNTLSGVPQKDILHILIVTNTLFHTTYGHYRFLPNGHLLWTDNEFVGIHESNDPLGEFSIEELLAVTP
jgi:hypothetical protein